MDRKYLKKNQNNKNKCEIRTSALNECDFIKKYIYY